jgi:hypothetical protein
MNMRDDEPGGAWAAMASMGCRLKAAVSAMVDQGCASIDIVAEHYAEKARRESPLRIAGTCEIGALSTVSMAASPG